MRCLFEYNSPSSGKVEWIDEAQGRGSGRTTGREITKEVAHKLSVLVDTTEENLLVLVLKGKVQGLRWEVSDNIGKVAAPVTQESLFFWDANETIDHT